MNNSLDFSNFKVVEQTNTRDSLKGRVLGPRKKFKLNFRKFISKKNNEEKEETLFHISEQLFSELNLKENGLLQIVSPDKISYLAVVANEDATILKGSRKTETGEPVEKGRKFKAELVRRALVTQGIINDDLLGEEQELDLVKVADASLVGEKGIQASAVYQVVKLDKSTEDNESDASGAEPNETISADQVEVDENEDF